MLARKRNILRNNLAFMPLVVLLELLGFHLECAKKNKLLRLIHSLSVLLLLLLASNFILYSVDTSVVVATITYINTRCIFYTLIIIYIRSMLARKSLRRVFKCFDNIDLSMQTTFGIKIKDDDSKWFMRVMILVLFISVFCCFAFECFNESVSDKMFNVGQFIHAMLVFILSVKISFYCMLCASIKARFRTLIKYLKDSKSTPTMIAAKTRNYVATKSIGNVSQVKEISLIYDEVLEIILLLNESFSALLSFAFGKMRRGRSELRFGGGGNENEICGDAETGMRNHEKIFFDRAFLLFVSSPRPDNCTEDSILRRSFSFQSER